MTTCTATGSLALDLLLINRFAMMSTGWKTNSSATPGEEYMLEHRPDYSGRPNAGIPDVPEPKMRAAPESLPLTFRVGAMAAEGQEARDGVRATAGRKMSRCAG